MLTSSSRKRLCFVSLLFIFLTAVFVGESLSSGISDKPSPASNQDRLVPVSDSSLAAVQKPNLAKPEGNGFGGVILFLLNHFQGISLLILLSVIPAMLLGWNREKTLIQ